MNNTIFTNMDGTIGYYSDIKKGYEELIIDAVKADDTEEVALLNEQLKDINEYKDFDGLLSLSNNNGFGFTCEPVIRADLLAKDIAGGLGEKMSEEDIAKMEAIIKTHFENRWLA